MSEFWDIILYKLHAFGYKMGYTILRRCQFKKSKQVNNRSTVQSVVVKCTTSLNIG